MLLQALHEFSLRKQLCEGLAFKSRNVRWIIPINQNGDFLGDGLIEMEREKTFLCPRTIRSKGVGGVAEFLADGITALFGLENEADELEESEETETEEESTKEDSRDNSEIKYEDFWKQIEEAFKETQLPSLQSMIRWKENNVATAKAVPFFLRWGSKKEGEKEKWWVKTASGEMALGAGDFFTFQVDGDVVLNNEELRNRWINVSNQERAFRDKDTSRGFCLLTGETNLPIMLSHPMIYGVPGASPMGAYLISYSSKKAGSKCSFSSFGWEKGENVSISTYAAESYAAALNELVSNKKYNVVLRPTILCFWTKETPEFTDLLTQLLNEPKEQTVQQFLTRWRLGVHAPLRDQDHFYSLMLTGNAGRVVVRRWIDQPLSDASEHLEQWFNDLRITEIKITSNKPEKGKKKGEPEETGTPLPYKVYHLACSMVRDAKELSPEIPVRLFAAALEGTPVPLAWLKPILHRFKCDLVKQGEPGIYPLSASRFALIKLTLIRNRKGDTFMPEVQLSETLDKPYNLGRLMAVLEYVQDKANEFKLEGAGVVEKYYASASAAPVTVFPILLRLCRHHLKKVEKIDGGAAFAVERKMESILALVRSDAPDQPPRFPRVLSLEEQGRFALGFYQQKAYDSAQRQNRKDNNTVENQ